MKRQKKTPEKVEEWVEFGSFSTNDESMSLIYLKQFIADNVPAGTPDENIKLSFVSGIEYGYYDECFADGQMILSYKKVK